MKHIFFKNYIRKCIFSIQCCKKSNYVIFRMTTKMRYKRIISTVNMTSLLIKHIFLLRNADIFEGNQVQYLLDFLYSFAPVTHEIITFSMYH